MMYKTMKPSCREARSVKALTVQPILVNSVTYHGFRVSFQVALESTTNTGQTERIRPIHSIRRFPLVSRTLTSTAFIYDSWTLRLATFSRCSICENRLRCGDSCSWPKYLLFAAPRPSGDMI